MYNVGDMVMYGAFGICKVTAIEMRDLTGEEQEYYILKHINSEKNIFYCSLTRKTQNLDTQNPKKFTSCNKKAS